MNTKIRIYDIIWDTDGRIESECANLPVEVIVDSIGGVDGVGDVDEYLSDYLSDEYGYCVSEFKYEIINNKEN